MPKQVNVHYAKTHLSSLLEDVKGGQEILLSKRGVPYAKLVPISEPPKRKLGFADFDVPDSFFDPLPESELRHWS